MTRYTFGTDDAGAIRLQSIAEVFDPLAIRFIRTYLGDQPRQTAVDLGCGPGFTTSMLAHASGCPDVYGLDAAAHFLQMAATRFPAYTFLQHDLTALPFPVRADVMYVRFVLSHLPDVVATVNRWTSMLNPGGLLFVDETEAVESEVEAFQVYLDTNAAMIAAQGANLWVGPTLAAGSYEAEVVASTCDRVPVANGRAAAWFLPNIQTVWRTDPTVQARLTPEERQSLADDVLRIKESGDARLHNTWHMRRLVLRATG